MSREFLNAIAAHRAEIEHHWRTLLRIEPVTSPLANPETLRYLIPRTLTEILDRAAKINRKVVTLEQARAPVPACTCGNNPYRAYFRAAELAITEAGVLVQARLRPSVQQAADLAELVYAVRSLARAEIDTFCGACTHRGRAPNCRFAHAASTSSPEPG
ncbi:MAG TPA: hypothetical protein VHE61_19140 [Opitutaceae bacterium]|nr:hypothetical protein [Opitutaceae bacterium]